ncbi:manganese/iron transport system permease protein [Desulfobaculum xiamenense]|uniref:Manganese/iron transport system permease protein n=1 Tax=Desulfobaculum xiamenense TaxID=995050 RepID=A0A846QMD3_9BACT|nr:metal ABC transporter permease [Desulfobaculum xiamenense]NJB66595.1 manganese/iron transport system permease protein [Desulfobaculum xiamenense]
MDASIFHYAFMQKALLAGFLGGVSCALAGVVVVTMRITAIGTCMAHAAFAGALLGILLGIDPTPLAFAFSLGAAGIIGPLADRADFAPETVVGIVFSAMLGLAFLFVGLLPGPRTAALNLFWGNILTVGWHDIAYMGGTTLVLLAALALFFKEIQAVLCHRATALAVGIPATAIFNAMLFATGATVAASLQSIGGLLIFSLIINPAAAAYQLSYSLKHIFPLAALFGVASCWGGLALSYAFDIPSGAVIVMLSTALFIACTILSPKKRGLSHRERLSLTFSRTVCTAGEPIRRDHVHR